VRVRRGEGASDGATGRGCTNARCANSRTLALSHPRTHPRTPGSPFGFTLIELMIVMALIVVLAGIALAVYGSSQTRAREAVLKENLFRMRDAIDQYYADKNQYPPTLDDLVSQKYLRALPEDPFTNSASTWQTVMSEIDPANPSAIPGVFDVKSGAESMALDGSRYADW